MTFYKKYLKYKNKYMALKNQIGCGNKYSEKIDKLTQIEYKYKNDKFDLLCIDSGFKNHRGECWNDSIQMFFCFQDGIKEIVQRKLFFLTVDEIIELAELRGRKKYLPKMYGNDKIYNDMKIKLKKYLQTLQDRFKIYYKREVEKDESDSSQTPRIGINAAMEGLDCVIPEYIFDEQVHGGGNYIFQIMIVTLLQYVLLDEDDLIIYKSNIETKVEESIYNNSLGCLCDSKTITGYSHMTLFYKCNNIDLYFDDNMPSKVKFNYKKYFIERYKYPTKYNSNDLSFGLKNENILFFTLNEEHIEYNPDSTVSRWYDYVNIDENGTINESIVVDNIFGTIIDLYFIIKNDYSEKHLSIKSDNLLAFDLALNEGRKYLDGLSLMKEMMKKSDKPF